jgi:pimeloyl-ACP methyl ester carboxylesterase
MLREGEGEPLVLLHGIVCTANVWEEVVPLLAPHYDTIAVTALGHRNGGAPNGRRVSMKDMTDEAERQIDELGLERPHLAGNSMGGWMAIELARRGRARSVCALSPSGAWDAGAAPETRSELRRIFRDAKRSRLVMPLALRSKRVRDYAMSLNANHGARMSPKQVLARTDDMLGCTVLDDLLDTEEALAPLDPLPCSITLAWAEDDRVLPLRTNGKRARELIPQARFVVLQDVGHVAMFDDPQLVADTIREACR